MKLIKTISGIVGLFVVNFLIFSGCNDGTLSKSEIKEHRGLLVGSYLGRDSTTFGDERITSVKVETDGQKVVIITSSPAFGKQSYNTEIESWRKDGGWIKAVLNGTFERVTIRNLEIWIDTTYGQRAERFSIGSHAFRLSYNDEVRQLNKVE